MTFEEIIENAKARALDFGGDWPTTHRVLYRRIEIRQQDLFTQANRVNPDYFGVSATGTLRSDNTVDLRDLPGNNLDIASSITRVEIEDEGTHPTLEAGDEIALVSPNDVDAALAPRMTLRNFILKPVGDDLDGVTSVCVDYGYRPQNNTPPMDGTEEAEIPDVYQELLVIDLAQWAMKQTISMDPQSKSGALEILQAEENEMLEKFMAEVADFAGAQVSRFGSVRGTQRL